MNFKVFLFIIFLFSVVYAQQPQTSPTPSKSEDKDNFDCGLVTPEQVKFNLSVWSSNKGYLKGLNYKNFEVYDGKEKQDIEGFSQKDESASIGILYDLSRSMMFNENKKLSSFPFAVDGLISLANNSNFENEYFIITFEDKVSVLLEPTQNRKKFEKGFSELLNSEMIKSSTKLFDAINLGFEKVVKGKFDKKVLIIISDGVDSYSKLNFDYIKKYSQQNSNVLIYHINIATNKFTQQYIDEPVTSMNWSEKLTENSGGRRFFLKDSIQIKEAFETISNELKSQYTICFTPKNDKRNSEWRKLTVKFNPPKELKKELGNITIRTRKGFYY